MKIPTFATTDLNNDTMWQRIQTLYLGISTALAIAMLFSRFATIAGPEGTEADIFYYEKIGYLSLLIMMTTAHIASIASFKVRLLQARVSIISALLAIGFQIWLAVDLFIHRNTMSFSITALFPLAIAFLDFIAVKATLTDEFTATAVKSLKKARKR